MCSANPAEGRSQILNVGHSARSRTCFALDQKVLRTRLTFKKRRYYPHVKKVDYIQAHFVLFTFLLLKAYGSKKQNIINNWVPSTFQNYHERNRRDTLYNPKRGERIKMSYLVWLYLYENASSLTIKILFIADGSKKAGPSCGSKTTPRSSPESDRVSQSQKSIQVNLFFSGIFFEKNSLCLKHHVLFAGNIASPS